MIQHVVVTRPIRKQLPVVVAGVSLAVGIVAVVVFIVGQTTAKLEMGSARLLDKAVVRIDKLSETVNIMNRDIGELRQQAIELDRRLEALTELSEESKVSSQIINIEQDLGHLEKRTYMLEEVASELKGLVRKETQETPDVTDLEKRMETIEERIIKDPEDALSVRLIEDRITILKEAMEKRAYRETVETIQNSVTLMGVIMAVAIAGITVVLSFTIAIVRSKRGDIDEQNIRSDISAS